MILDRKQLWDLRLLSLVVADNGSDNERPAMSGTRDQLLSTAVPKQRHAPINAVSMMMPG
jgi:hypothetical protein